MQIFVKGLDGRTTCLDVNSRDLCLDVKHQLEVKFGIASNEQRLIFEGKQLTDDYALDQYQIQAHSTLHLVLSLRGGGNWFSAQVNQQKQTTTNDIYQRSEQICNAQCSQIQSGNTVFLDGSTTGDITFNQQCDVEASCMMNNAIDTVLEVLQDIKQGNATEASLFPNFGSVNLNLSDQELRNEVQQILETVCSADVEQQQGDNMVYARNSSTGDIGFFQQASARANCVMTNSASANLNLQQKGDQSNTIAGLGLGGIIGLVIVIVIILVIVNAFNRGSRRSGDRDDDRGSSRRQFSYASRSGNNARIISYR